MIDIHNHLIYGVDDGSRSIEDSIKVLDDLSKCGITDVILTPHYIPETKYVNSKIDNIKRMERLKKELKSNNININLYIGNEIYIDKNLIDYFKSNEMSTLNNTEYALIELPMSGNYPDYQDILSYLIEIGFKVVLAHPERYTSIQKNFDLLYELQDIGVLFQCNIDSILGYYGKEAKKVIKRMLKEKLISFIGTDIHNSKDDYSFIDKSISKFKKYLNSDEIEDILINNPMKIIKK